MPAKRGRRDGPSARDGYKHGYKYVGSGAGGYDIRRCAGEPGADAEAAALMAGGRRVEVGTAVVGYQRGAAGEHAGFAVGAVPLRNDFGDYRGRPGLFD